MIRGPRQWPVFQSQPLSVRSTPDSWSPTDLHREQHLVLNTQHQRLFDWLIKESLLPYLIPWFIGVRQRDCRQGGRDIEATVRQVIGGTVDAGEVIDLFAAAGLEDAQLDILLRRISYPRGCAGAEEPGAGNAAQTADRLDSQHRANQSGAEQEVPRSP